MKFSAILLVNLARVLVFYVKVLQLIALNAKMSQGFHTFTIA